MQRKAWSNRLIAILVSKKSQVSLSTGRRTVGYGRVPGCIAIYASSQSTTVLRCPGTLILVMGVMNPPATSVYLDQSMLARHQRSHHSFTRYRRAQSGSHSTSDVQRPPTGLPAWKLFSSASSSRSTSTRHQLAQGRVHDRERCWAPKLFSHGDVGVTSRILRLVART